MKETQIQEASLFPVNLGIGKDEVEHRHEKNVSWQKY